MLLVLPYYFSLMWNVDSLPSLPPQHQILNQFARQQELWGLLCVSMCIRKYTKAIISPRKLNIEIQSAWGSLSRCPINSHQGIRQTVCSAERDLGEILTRINTQAKTEKTKTTFSCSWKGTGTSWFAENSIVPINRCKSSHSLHFSRLFETV